MSKKWTIAASIAFALATRVAFGQTLVFPHLANGRIGDGTLWSTEIEVANTSSSPQTVKISFFNQDGTPKTMSWPAIEAVPPSGLGSFSSLTGTFQPGTMIVMETDGGFNNFEPQSAGWTLVEGSGGIKATLTFRRKDFSGNVMAQAGVLPQSPTTNVSFIPVLKRTFADHPPFGERVPAFAIANPDPAVTASGEIQMLNERGELIATSPFTLPPRNQIAQFVHERFGPLEGFRYLRIRVDT